MPSVDWNRSKFDADYSWRDAGAEWSNPWGGVEAQWRTTLWPRIEACIPAQANVLEIACGQGRWSGFLAQHARQLIAVDLSTSAIAHCQQRYVDHTHMQFHANDGQSMPMVADHSIDFAFSFDSLVHVNADVLEAYLIELTRVLKPGAMAFIHHSNLAANPGFCRWLRAKHIYRIGRSLRLLEHHHCRDPDVSAELVAQRAQQHGLSVVSQEIHAWLEKRVLLDCFTVLQNGTDQQACKRFINHQFYQEATAL